MICNSKEQSVLEILGKAGIEIDIDLPEVVYTNNVIAKSSYLLFPIQGREGVLYIDTTNEDVYIYNVEAKEYRSVTRKLTPMTDEDVEEMINIIKGVD